MFAAGRFDRGQRRAATCSRTSWPHGRSAGGSIDAVRRIADQRPWRRGGAARGRRPPRGSSPCCDARGNDGSFREPAAAVPLTGRAPPPPADGSAASGLLALGLSKDPPGASSVTLSVAGDSAVIAAGTKISNTTGAITVATGQTGGSAHVEARQDSTAPDGSTTTTTATAPFNFTAIPSGITDTSASAANSTGFYGGTFTHTFGSPAGGQSALELVARERTVRRRELHDADRHRQARHAEHHHQQPQFKPATAGISMCPGRWPDRTM